MRGMLKDLLGRAGHAMAELRRLAQKMGVTEYEVNDPANLSEAIWRQFKGERELALYHKEQAEHLAKEAAVDAAQREQAEKERDVLRTAELQARGEADRLRDELGEVRASMLKLAGLTEEQVDDETWLSAARLCIGSEKQDAEVQVRRLHERLGAARREMTDLRVALLNGRKAPIADPERHDLADERMDARALGLGLLIDGDRVEVRSGDRRCICSADTVGSVLTGIRWQRLLDEGNFASARATLEGLGYRLETRGVDGVNQFRIVNPKSGSEVVSAGHQLRLIAMGARMHAKSVRNGLEKLHAAVGGDPDTRAEQDIGALFDEAIEEGAKGRIAWELLSTFVDAVNLDPKASDLMLNLTDDAAREELAGLLKAHAAAVSGWEAIMSAQRDRTEGYAATALRDLAREYIGDTLIIDGEQFIEAAPPTLIVKELRSKLSGLKTEAEALQRLAEKHIRPLEDGSIFNALDAKLTSARSASRPAAQQAGKSQPPGLYGKFYVSRVDGRDAVGGDRADAEYFVLDRTHDPFALAALEAYAGECHETLPELSADLKRLIGSSILRRTTDPVFRRACFARLPALGLSYINSGTPDSMPVSIVSCGETIFTAKTWRDLECFLAGAEHAVARRALLAGCPPTSLTAAIEQHIAEETGARDSAIAEGAEIIAELEAKAAEFESKYNRLTHIVHDLGSALDEEPEEDEGTISYAHRLVVAARELMRASVRQSQIIDSLASAAGVQQRSDEEYDDFLHRAKKDICRGAIAHGALTTIADELDVHYEPETKIRRLQQDILDNIRAGANIINALAGSADVQRAASETAESFGRRVGQAVEDGRRAQTRLVDIINWIGSEWLPEGTDLAAVIELSAKEKYAIIQRAISRMVPVASLSPMAGIHIDEGETPSDYVARLRWQVEHFERLLYSKPVGDIELRSNRKAPDVVEPWSALVFFTDKAHGGGFKLFQARNPGSARADWYCAGMPPIEPGGSVDLDYWHLRCPKEQADEPDAKTAFGEWLRENETSLLPIVDSLGRAAGREISARREAEAMGLRPVVGIDGFRPMTTQDFNAFRPPLGALDDGSPWPIESDTDTEDFDEDDDVPTEPRVTLLGDSIGARMMRAMYAVPALLKLERDTERDEVRGIPATWGACGQRTKVELINQGGLVKVVATYDTRVAGRREHQITLVRPAGSGCFYIRVDAPDRSRHNQVLRGPGRLGDLRVSSIDDHDEVRAAVRRLLGTKEQGNG